MIQKIVIWLRSQYRLSASSGAVRDIAKLMTGSLLSQVAPILAAPILTRIYQPSDYGLVGLYISISGLIGLVATLQFNQAIVVAKNDEEAVNLITLCAQLLIGGSILSFLLIWWLMFAGIVPPLPFSFNYFWLLPFSVLCTGLASVFGSYALRIRQIRLISSGNILTAMVSTFCSIGFGLWFRNLTGLFLGLWLSQFANSVYLFSGTIYKNPAFLFKKLFLNQWATAKKYANFFRFSLPASFINNFTHQVPVLMLNAWSLPAAAGSFNLSRRMLGLPMAAVSGPIGEIYFQRASKAYREKGGFSRIFLWTLKSLSLFSILPFALLILFAPWLFVFIFGESWEEAGQFARIMGLMYFLRFTTSPLSRTMLIVDKQYITLLIDLYLFISNALIFYISLYLLGSVSKAVLFYSLNYSLLSLFSLWISYKYSKSEMEGNSDAARLPLTNNHKDATQP